MPSTSREAHMNCLEEVAVTPELRRPLEVADGAYEVEDRYRCELVPGHPGPHLSIGQSKGDTDLWIRWSDEVAAEVVGLDPCDASRPDEESFCVLPEGHPGPHNDAQTRWA